MMRTFISHFTPSKYFYNFLIILVTHIFQSNKKPGKPLIVRAFPAFPGQSPTVPTISLFLTFILLGYRILFFHTYYLLLYSTRYTFFSIICVSCTYFPLRVNWIHSIHAYHLYLILRLRQEYADH